MAISSKQKATIHKAKAEAHLDDDDYRDMLAAVSGGLRSSAHPSFGNRHFDLFMGFCEAVFFRKLDAGEITASARSNAVFRTRGFWKTRNINQETTRDRYMASQLGREIAALESALSDLGFGPAYVAAIEAKVAQGRAGSEPRRFYAAALRRTLKSKQKLSSGPCVC